MTPAVILGYAILCALLLVGYAYLGYPLVIAVAARLFGRKPVRPQVADEHLPTVTVLVAAYNEAHEIAGRVENALALDYPAGKLDVVIASDGSTDATAEIVRRYADRGVTCRAFADRRGKATVLNDALPAVRGEVVLLSDANTYTDPSAARKLAAWFADPAVGAVCGRLVLVDPVRGKNVDGLYWKYETFLKKCEARLGALLGSNGGIYALRRAVYQPIPNDTIVDDFVIPLLARQRTGSRIVYDTGAVATEETPPSIGSEFHRRARIGAGGYQAIGLLRGLLHPRHGWLAFAFLNHKLLRWLSPFFLLFALLGNVGWVLLCMPHLGSQWLLPWASLLLAGQVGFYTCSLLAAFLPPGPKLFRVLRLPAMFTSMNAALGVGLYRYVRGRQHAAWKRTLRTGEPQVHVATASRSDPMRDTDEMPLLADATNIPTTRTSPDTTTEVVR